MKAIDDELKEFIQNEILEESDGEVLPSDTPLLAGVLDSLGLLQLLVFLDERFGLRVSNDEVVEENFETVATVAAFVAARTQSESKR